MLHSKQGSTGALEIDCQFTGRRSSLLPDAALSAHGSYTRTMPPSFFTDGREIHLHLPRFRYKDAHGARRTLSCRPYFLQEYAHHPMPVLIVLYILKLCKDAKSAVEGMARGMDERKAFAVGMLHSSRRLIVRTGLSFAARRSQLATVRRFLLDFFGSSFNCRKFAADISGQKRRKLLSANPSLEAISKLFQAGHESCAHRL